MLRMNRVATIAANNPRTQRVRNISLEIFFLLGFYRFYGKETKYMKAFFLSFSPFLCFLVLTQEMQSAAAAAIADYQKPRYLYLGDHEC